MALAAYPGLTAVRLLRELCHCRGPQSPHQPKPFLAAPGRERGKSCPLQMPHNELAHGRIVVYHQDQRLFRVLGNRMNGLRTGFRLPLAHQRFAALHDPWQPLNVLIAAEEALAAAH